MNPFKLTFSLLLLCLTFALGAQDTIVVQTITLNSDERAGVFEFPDDPEQSYEKILMRYQMRCHGAQVGSGNVGCREWDYSCNTFITDSTRVDSNQLTHPSYLISNFSGNAFDYTTQPTYTYYQYEQREVTYTDTLSENVAIVGSGTEPLEFAGTSLTTKAQLLFTADELTTAGLAAGPITGMKLDVASVGGPLAFLRIKMKATTQTELDEANPDLDGFEEVYFLNTTFENTGDHPFNFYNSFDWDGTSNVLVEMSFTNAESTMLSQLNSHQTTDTKAIISDQTDYNLQFNGSGNIPLNATGLASVQNEITVALWCYGATNILPVNSTIFEGQDAANQRQVNVHLPWGNGQVYWDCGNDGSGYDRINIAADPSAWKGQWNHWAFTKNTATGSMKMYLNGELFHSGTGKTKPIDIATFNFAGDLAGNNHYYGNIDELQIWDVELNQATIQEWMRKKIDANHPNYQHLLLYLPLNDGTGSALTDASENMLDASVTGMPGWQQTRGQRLFKGFKASSLRPNVRFLQGEYTAEESTITVRDSILNSPHQVIEFGVQGTDLVAVDTFFVYGAGATVVYDENGDAVDFVDNPAENTLIIDDLVYYQKFPAKYEILSLVTPYGNGLDLGPNGKTFTFDVTDYAPILRDSKRLSIEMGGQNQEELDIRFLFITGTPPREVLDVQNIWPFRRGGFAAIQDDAVFEPRMLELSEEGSAYKIRASITGHAQNGEFVQRTHYLNVGGGANEFEFPVWKECGNIPIYPQGGTWLFDRAGWCPGDPTEVHHFDITPLVSQGATVEVDYGVVGGPLTEANYLVSNQLVTYGPANFNTDAAVIDVIRPSTKVEHERFNPACNSPVILIQNTGASTLTSLDISYRVVGGEPWSYTWIGSLEMMETEEVALPVNDISFWTSTADFTEFEVVISNPNGGTDEYVNNNSIRSPFNAFSIFEGTIQLKYKTNTRPQENRMYITDASGDIVLERMNMTANTTYVDQLDLPSGCYTMHFTDTGGDGLYYWYWEAIGQNVGSGYLRFERKINDNVSIPIRTFESEFGSAVQYDFFLPEPVAVEDVVTIPTLISVSPNPNSGQFTVELIGFEQKDLQLELFNASGQKLLKQNHQHVGATFKTQFNLSDQPAGVYLLRIFDGVRAKYQKVVVE